MSKNRNIAIVFDDLTEFFVFRPIIDELRKQKIPVDIIVPFDSGYNGLPEHTSKALKDLGYPSLNDAPKNKTYQILLTPYPDLAIVKRVKFIYHLQYPYGAASPKPNPTFLPSFRMGYDAIISFNTIEQHFLDAYGSKNYPVPYWRYANFKKEPHKSPKPNLLILATFGEDISCIKYFTDSSIKEIKKHFHIITKAHHAIHFGRDGQEPLDRLKNIADEFFDSDTPIDTLLKKADIVLSDNSGAIFDAMCAGIPVALFAKDLNSRRIGHFDTLQYTLAKQNILPHATSANQLLPTLLKAKSYAKKQREMRYKLFLKIPADPLKPCLDVIHHFLDSDPVNDKHKIIRDIVVQEWNEDKQTISSQELKIQELNQMIQELNNKVQDYNDLVTYKKNAESAFNSGAYKLFNKLIIPYKKLKRKQ